MARAGGEPGALAAQCKELQRKLDEALRERDDLVRDLEAFCLSDGGTTFNSSSVLQERIYSTGALGGAAALWVLGAGLGAACSAPLPPPPLAVRRLTRAAARRTAAARPQRRSWLSTGRRWRRPPRSGTGFGRTWRR